MNTPQRKFPHRLAMLLSSLRDLHALRASASRVDGAIVGTGQADFTVSNVLYRFGRTGQGFCLMDVPGIEGNESRYADLVRDALARAHVVFYVNGTNKKPETETASKIAAYLSHDTIVHPIINVRGRADAYELPDDRVSITASHADIVKNAALTEDVLRDRLGEDVVRPAMLVQGMAALSAAALSGRSTTLAPERIDLLRAQRGMLEAFGDAGDLRSFSQIDQVRHLLLGYADGGGREAIVEANRRRIVRLVTKAVDQLDVAIRDNELATATVSTNIASYSDSIVKTVKESESALSRSASVAVDTAFAALSIRISGIIEEHFQSSDKAKTAADRETSVVMDGLREKIQALAAESAMQLQDDVKEALTRLKADVASIRNASFKTHKDGFVLSLGSALDAIDFQLADAGKLLARMGSYALAGAGLGTTVLGVGNVIGAAVGSLFGALVEIGMYFGFGRDKKIREAQTRALASLAKSSEELKEQIGESITRQYADLRRTLNEKVLGPLSAEVNAMKNAGRTLGRQHDRIAALLEDIKESTREPV